MPRSRSLVLVLAVLASCCFGLTARQKALLPILRDSWTRVQGDVEAGSPTPAPEKVAEVRTALDTGTQDAVQAALPTWDGLRAAADAGYSVRGVDPGIAASLRERLRQFDAGLREFAGEVRP